MSTTEPQDLMDVLMRLEESRKPQPAAEKKRRYRRFNIRGDARIEPIDESPLAESIPVLLRDMSRGGVGFLVDRFIEPSTYWRLRFMHQGHVIGSQTMCLRFCRLVEQNLYIAGGQFVIEPYLMHLLGVPAAQLRDDDLAQFSELDVSEFVPPEGLVG